MTLIKTAISPLSENGPSTSAEIRTAVRHLVAGAKFHSICSPNYRKQSKFSLPFIWTTATMSTWVTAAIISTWVNTVTLIIVAILWTVHRFARATTFLWGPWSVFIQRATPWRPTRARPVWSRLNQLQSATIVGRVPVSPSCRVSQTKPAQ